MQASSQPTVRKTRGEGPAFTVFLAHANASRQSLVSRSLRGLLELQELAVYERRR